MNIIPAPPPPHPRSSRLVDGGARRAHEEVRVFLLEGEDHLAKGDRRRERLVRQGRAGERARVVGAEPAEDLAPLVGVAVGGLSAAALRRVRHTGVG